MSTWSIWERLKIYFTVMKFELSLLLLLLVAFPFFFHQTFADDVFMLYLPESIAQQPLQINSTRDKAKFRYIRLGVFSDLLADLFSTSKTERSSSGLFMESHPIS